MNLSKKTTITILICIIIFGAILRFYNLSATSFVADEFLDINSSMAYAKTGIWQNWDFNFGKVNTENVFEARDSRAWIYKWQVAQVLKIFSPTEAAARSISVIWGVISIIFIYLVARYFTKKGEIGLIAAFLFAVSVSGIMFDRKLRMYAMFFAVFLAFSWFVFRFLEEKYKGENKLIKIIQDKFGVNALYLIPALVLGVISILTHQLSANIVFVILFYTLIQMARSQNKFSFFNKYFLIILVLVVSYVGAEIFYSEQLKIYTSGLAFFTAHWSYFSKAFVDYGNILLPTLFLALGTYYLGKKQELFNEALWLSVSFLGTLLAAVFMWDRNVGDQYIFFIESFLIILIASGIWGTAEFFGENLEKYKKRAYLIPVVLALLLLPNWGYFFQESNTYKQTSESDSANYKKVFGYFMKARKDGDVLISRNFRNYYWSGAKVKVFDFGGELNEEKLSLEEIQKTVAENPSGWLIISDNDDAYISNEAMEYVVKNFERVSNPQVRGKVSVYRWGN